MSGTGIHIILDLHQCDCEEIYLKDSEFTRQILMNIVVASGLTICDNAFHQFMDEWGMNQGFSGAIIFAESHFTIHTWPENKKVDADIYVCNYLNDNSDKARFIVEEVLNIFLPKHKVINELMRGE